MQTALVAVDRATLSFDEGFTYLCPDSLLEQVVPGVRVIVPFGRGNGQRHGVVLKVDRVDKLPFACKKITKVVDSYLADNKDLLDLVLHLQESTICTYYEAVKAVLPSALDVKIQEYYHIVDTDNPMLTAEQEIKEFARLVLEADNYLPIQQLPGKLKGAARRAIEQKLAQRTVKTKQNYSQTTVEYVKAVATTEKLSEKQLQMHRVLQQEGPMRSGDLIAKSGFTRSVLNTLIKKGAVCREDQFYYKSPIGSYPVWQNTKICLSDEQQKIYNRLAQKCDEGKVGGNLLFGVTGSGKTLIYIKLIEHVLSLKKTALMLVPEIALTPQMVARFSAYFPGKIALMHSGLAAGEKVSEYYRIQTGQASVVIGTRSAIFAPLKNIGLIIVDEEQESSYHSESQPRYSADEVAAYRAKKSNAQLLLASATPRITTYYRAVVGKIELFTLKERYNGQQLPRVEIVDMNQEIARGNTRGISGKMTEQIAATVGRGEQVILLLNRRGYNTSFVCSNCGAVAKCKHCDIPLTYHKKEGKLICHYCGRAVPVMTVCDNCGDTHVHPYGAGTQKIEDELGQLFPDVSVLRVDTDIFNGQKNSRQLFYDFYNHQYDILVGTQMVAKGHDFPGVTLVGVLGVDRLLTAPSYKSYERAFSLITQVIGRAGRASKTGSAVVQTIDPDSEILALAAKQDYLAFYNSEIESRRVMLYPPFCSICLVSFVSISGELAKQAGLAFAKRVQQLVPAEYNIPIRMMGPTPYFAERINDKHRYKVILKCKNNKLFRKMIRDVIADLAKQKVLAKVSMSVDLNPDSEI